MSADYDEDETKMEIEYEAEVPDEIIGLAASITQRLSSLEAQMSQQILSRRELNYLEALRPIVIDATKLENLLRKPIHG